MIKESHLKFILKFYALKKFMNQLNLSKCESSQKSITAKHLQVHRSFPRKPVKVVTCLVLNFKAFRKLVWVKHTVQ